MSEIANSEGASETEKPVQTEVKFPPFPDPTDNDFDEDISEEERTYYKNKFKDLNTIKTYRLHCTSCDRHLGCSARNERMRAHPMLRTLVCHTCHTFYNSGEFEKGDDGSELYCRWCGQGGQVYCCSDCPHVFCAKCIKRNMGAPKIKEIENADDWKCFKCNTESLRDLRAVCWAVLRYCDLKNKITYLTEDADLKAAYQKECALDLSECCKRRRSHKIKEDKDSLIKKKDVKKEVDVKTTAANIISKMPSTIQVKKFASVCLEDIGKQEKKAQKRSASPKPKPIMVKNPITITTCYPPKILTQVAAPSLPKKIRLPVNCTINAPIRFPQERKMTYSRLRPKIVPQLPIPIANNCYNGYVANVFHCANPVNDNINLSLESLTQGLDMSAVAALSNNIQDDDVVCTPDFPLEPLCEVTEDNDDDVQCITPGPVAAPKLIANPPPLVPRTTPSTPDVTSENIIQMTDNDVTVNESTGGLKFRVDPQTLSSNKMYRLPDGRIFAINANPNMPGGYSATIVAVTEASKGVPKGATFAAKLSSVTTSTPTTKNRNQVTRMVNTKRVTKISKQPRVSESSGRECDLNVPVEWYRYNLIDSVDALEYSLSRLHKLKKEATSVYLRSRSVTEMRNLHRTLERLLNTSSTRFNEIRDNLNKGLKQYVHKKSGAASSEEEEDDDVEILPNMDEDPIFIDENSVESNINGNESQEVDLTGAGSSEYNDSGENRNDKRDLDSLNVSEDLENGDHGEFPIIIRKIKTVQVNKKGGDKDVESSLKDTEIVSMSNDDIKEVSSVLRVIGESLNNGLTTSRKEVEENDLAEVSPSDKADNQISDKKMEDSGDKLLDSDDKELDETDVKMQELDDETKNLDEKMESLDDTVDGSDDKMEASDDKIEGSDDKIEVSDDKIELSDDKIELSDDKIEGSDNKIEGSNHKIKGSDDKIDDSDDKTEAFGDITQIAKNKIPDDENDKQNDEVTKEDVEETQPDDEDDKMQDSEISEEMIETLLKDDNSRDSATTNTEAPKALQVT